MSTVTLLPDNDPEGESGFKDLLWQLASHGLETKLAWSRESHNGKFNELTPEKITKEMWEQLN